ncbi:MAG: hypothetical protein V4598_10260 [Bdellovibrionota bacterium]
MKSLRIFFALLLTVVTLTASKPSQAAIGAAVSTPLLIAGIVIAGGGAVTTLISVKKCQPDGTGLCSAFVVLLLAPVVILGLALLDGEQQVEFRELNSKEAAKLEVSASELAVYNSEIDQANMLVADVKSELSKIEKPSEADSAKAWGNVKDLVSAETFSVMQKIVSQK